MIHAYIVAKAMTEWYRYTVPTRVEEQLLLCENARREIRKILGARVRMLANVRAIEIIIGDDAKPTVTMLYYTDNEKIEEMPTEGSPGQIHTTDDRQREFSQPWKVLYVWPWHCR